MNPLRWIRPVRFAAALAAAFAAPSAPLSAQTGCPDFGSTPVAAAWLASPIALGCAGAPEWPVWHLFTPAHRAPGPHAGHAPGDAHAWPVLLIGYRCTGLWFAPVVPDHVRAMGYVIDQPEYPCGATTP